MNTLAALLLAGSLGQVTPDPLGAGCTRDSSNNLIVKVDMTSKDFYQWCTDNDVSGRWVEDWQPMFVDDTPCNVGAFD